MAWWVIGTLMFVGLFILLAVGMPVAFGLFTVALVSSLFLWGPDGLLTLAANSYSSLANYLLLSAPLFIFMGVCIEISGLGSDIFEVAEDWLGSIRGGLAICTVAAATVFGAATGFSGTASSAFGPVALSQMARRKYDPGLALGAMGGGSAIAVLIPPSVPLLMYGFLSGTSVSRLFYAGLIPGILASLLFMVYISVRAHLNPALAPVGIRTSWSKRVRNTWRIFPLVVLVALVLGSLWGGIATPTEAAALGSLAALVLVIAYRRLSWHSFKEIIVKTAEITIMVFAIIIGAFAFTQILSVSGFVTNFSALVANLPVSPWLIIVLMMLVNIFLGCFLDTMGVMFLTLPIYLPVVSALGFDLIWFGVLVVINTEIGSLTPPVGLNLYILKAVSPPQWSMKDAIMGVAPYWFLYLLLLVLVMLIPSLALWLPSLGGSA